jgi:hypothetical protein
MNFKYHALTTLGTMLLFAKPFHVNAVAVGVTTAAIAGSVSSRSSHIYIPGSTSQDVIRNFQLGNHSYELVRFSQYDLRHYCFGHQARNAEGVMDDIERVCGAVAEVSYPALKPAGMLLRESNYFDCGRDQLRVDLIDKSDLGQQCAVEFINANGKEWVNGAQAKVWKGVAMSGWAMAVAVLAILI